MIKIKNTGIDYITNEQVIERPYTKNTDTAQGYTFIRDCNFYKLFWIFIIGSMFGCYMEQIQYYYLRGIWECRAGVIWGPFSEIYGCGSVLMFLLYQKIKKASPLVIFFTSSILGSAFEYLARLFQEIFFGSISWNYSKEILNLGGRTSLKYGIYWGALGLIFINLIFPHLSRLLEKMKGRTAFVFTWLLIIFMSLDLLCSALAVNRWNERLLGVKPHGAAEEFFDDHYGNEQMELIYPHLRFMASTK